MNPNPNPYITPRNLARRGRLEAGGCISCCWAHVAVFCGYWHVGGCTFPQLPTLPPAHLDAFAGSGHL